MPLTAPQQQKAQIIMNTTATTYQTMWEAINRYVVANGGKALPWQAKIVQESYQHLANNAVTNQFAENPAKYTMAESAGFISGIGIGFIGAKAGAVIGGLVSAPVTGSITIGTLGVVGGGLAIKTLFNFAYDNSSSFKNWVDGFNDPSTANIIPVEIKNYLNDLATETTKSINESLEKLSKDFNQTVEDVTNSIRETYQNIVNKLAQTYDFIANKLSELLNDVGNFVNDVWEGIKDFFANPTDLSNAWNDAKLGNFDPAPNIEKATRDATTLTPISLDLSGNGRIDLLSSTTANNKVFFDIDNDGFREKTSWITGGDGWLARDSNNNGVIDNQRELFGDIDSKLAYQKLADLNNYKANNDNIDVDMNKMFW